MLGSLGLRTLQLRHVSLSLPGRLDRSVADHERLLDAYADRDAALAVALTRAIIMAGLRGHRELRLVRPALRAARRSRSRGTA